MRQNGGNIQTNVSPQYIVNASTYTAPGSGFQEAYLVIGQPFVQSGH